jgi:two-component sensor histidine kinase
MKLLFRWRESGAGPVAQPERSGFGSELIRELVPYMLNGRAELRFLHDGVACDLEIPLGRLTRAPSGP